MGCLLQVIFPTQELNLCLLHCRQTLYHLSHHVPPQIQSPSFALFSISSYPFTGYPPEICFFLYCIIQYYLPPNSSINIHMLFFLAILILNFLFPYSCSDWAHFSLPLHQNSLEKLKVTHSLLPHGFNSFWNQSTHKMNTCNHLCESSND